MPRSWFAAAAWSTIASATVLAAARPHSVGGPGNPAEELRYVVPLAEAAWPTHDVSLDLAAAVPGATPVLRWRNNELPLPAARDRVDVGLLGADMLVVLAGGVRESLDIYLLASTGEIRRLATDGGRRLPGTFARGRGSWPVGVGGQVFVAAFEKSGRVELRAFGPARQMFASRSWPAETRGFDVAVEAHRVIVRPVGVPGGETVEFPHPQAPRVEPVRPQIDFAAVIVGGAQSLDAELRNPGGLPIEVEVEVEGGGAFQVSPRRLTIPPRATSAVQVLFRPSDLREHRSRLLIRYAGVGQTAMLLRGRGRTYPVDAAAPRATTPAPAPVVVERASAPVELQSSVATAQVAAAAPARSVRPAPPSLTHVDDALLIEGQPGERVMIAVVSVWHDGTGLRPLRPLSTFAATLASRTGRLRVPLSEILSGGAPAYLLAVRRVGGELVESNLLEVRSLSR